MASTRSSRVPKLSRSSAHLPPALLSIPTAERPRSLTEFLAGLETTNLLIHHFGPGKKSNKVPKNVTKEMAVRLLEAAWTSPLRHPQECACDTDVNELIWSSLESFRRRHRSLEPSMYVGESEEALRAAALLYDVFQFGSPADANAIVTAEMAHGILSGLSERGQAAAVAAALQQAWPDTKLTLNDLLACSHYILGCILYHSGRLDIYLDYFQSAVALCSGPAWGLIRGGPCMLSREGRFASASSLWHSLLEKCKVEDSDPLRSWWIRFGVLEDLAVAPGGWDPYAAQELLKDAEVALEESGFKTWGACPFKRNLMEYNALHNVIQAGIGVATALGRRRILPVGIILNDEDLKIHVDERTGGTCCDVCGKEGSTQLCSRCRARRFCGSSCQKKDWKTHKKACCQVQAIIADLKIKLKE